MPSFISVKDIHMLSPMLIIGVVSIAVLLLEVFQRNRGSRNFLAWFSVLGLAAAGLYSTYLLSNNVNEVVVSGMVAVDSFSLTFNILFAGAGILGCLISPGFLESHRIHRGEYYGLLLFSVFGMMVMSSAMDLFTMFIGLELMSIPIYCMAGMFRHSRRSAESSMKYFILGAFSSVFFLYGIAFLYGLTGTTNLSEIAQVMSQSLDAFYVVSGTHNVTGEQVLALSPLPAIAIIMVLLAFAFKVSAVPFHMWTPDVYTGAPSSVVGFMATAVKAAAFAGLIRLVGVAFFDQPARMSDTGWVILFFWLAIFSMALGNLVAMVQSNVKRMLAYSSIAHAGYLLVGVVAAGHSKESLMNMDAVIFYLISYTFATMGAFGVLAYLGKRGEEVVTYDDLAGLARRHPGPALAMTIFMLSSAGIPPTAGFAAKFMVFKSAVQTGEQTLIVLAIVGVLLSVAGVYYYLQVILHIYMKDPVREVEAVGGLEARIALVVCAVGTLLLGILPSYGLDFSHDGMKRARGLTAEIAIERPVEVAMPELKKERTDPHTIVLP